MKYSLKSTGFIFLSVGLMIIMQSCPVPKKFPPTVTTANVTDITQTSAISGGNVTKTGGEDVTARGVCWGTTQNPTTAMSITSDGKGNDAFTSSITGLSANTNYFVRAYATNSEGTSYGNEDAFITSQIAVPVLTTAAITSVTQTTAVSGGNITDENGGSVTQRGVCWSTTSNPIIDNSKTSDGTGSGSYTSTLTGLIGNTLYYVRAYATNSAGTQYGNQVSFTTSPIMPALSTTTISSLTQTTASSGGNITSDGGSPITARGVCWSTMSGPTTALSTKTTDGTGIGIFTSSLTSLTPGTTYYVRAYATNSAGTAYGDEISFTTTAILIPTLTTTAITSIAQATASSGGNITSDGGAGVTAHGVCWNTSAGPTIANSKTSDGSGSGSFTSSLTGLTANKTYYVQAYATNSVGTAYGNELSFTTLCSAPSAITNAATSITTTTATLNGMVNANNFSTTVTFDYGTTTSYGSSATASQSPVTGSSNISVNVGVTSLSAGTLYHYRVNTVNCGGTILGSDMTFTTSSLVIGDSYQGGIVAYILQNGDPGFDSGQQHGLIAAPSDQSTGIQWYNGSYTITGATATALGTGNANTNTIVAAQGAGSYAAKLCYDLVLGGYSDWYLPSEDELHKLYLNKEVIGGFTNGLYWSSTEYSDYYAFYWSFHYDSTDYTNKPNPLYVRAIRAF